LGFEREKIPKVLLNNFIEKKPEFKQMTNWKQWSAIKKAVLAKIRNRTERQVKSLVSWQVYRKNVLGKGLSLLP
jgi:hypothetical protein